VGIIYQAGWVAVRRLTANSVHALPCVLPPFLYPVHARQESAGGGTVLVFIVDGQCRQRSASFFQPMLPAEVGQLSANALCMSRQRSAGVPCISMPMPAEVGKLLSAHAAGRGRSVIGQRRLHEPAEVG